MCCNQTWLRPSVPILALACRISLTLYRALLVLSDRQSGSGSGSILKSQNLGALLRSSQSSQQFKRYQMVASDNSEAILHQKDFSCHDS